MGKAAILRERVKSYFNPNLLGAKTQMLVAQIKKIEHIVADSEFEALLLEAALVKKYNPKYNSRLKDDKSFLYIKITNGESPRIYPARKTQGGYGPFPSASVVKHLLRQIRPIFPYCSCKISKKSCLYVGLGLCPGPYHSEIDKKNYRKTICNIKKLFEGKSNKLIRQLYIDMNQTSKIEDFEKAAIIRDQITRLNWLKTPRHLAAEYLANPNLIEDLRKEEQEDLQNELGKHLTSLSSVSRIEAYDISNISGVKATGSMVVFMNAEPDKSEYRKFKIKSVRGSNDIAMMREMLKRRFNHIEWDLPGLILIDGGKGQVNAILKVLKERKLEIPVIGLTKRLEEIVVPQDGKFKVLRFASNRPALNLLKRLRDEAHRFARGYHLKLREKISP